MVIKIIYLNNTTRIGFYQVFLLEKTPAKWSFGEIWEKKHEDPKKIPKKRLRRSRGLFWGIFFGSECFFAKNCLSCHSRGWAQKPQGIKLHKLPFTRISQKSMRRSLGHVRITLLWIICKNPSFSHSFGNYEYPKKILSHLHWFLDKRKTYFN